MTMIENESGNTGRLVTRITVTYRNAADPKAGEYTLSLVHGGGGAEVNGVVWDNELIRKLAYLEGDDCVVPKKIAGRDEWKVETGSAEGNAGGDCIWIHRTDCTWLEYCPEE
jgi:hypothetical protein